MVPEAGIALEKLLLRRKELCSILVNVDAYDRWGPQEGPERDQIFADGAAAQKEHDEVSQQLAARSAELWQREPDTIRAWAEAHVDLLERYRAAHAGDPSDDTACFVAKEELGKWREVGRGELGYVDENCAYVSVDRARHGEWFGPIW